MRRTEMFIGPYLETRRKKAAEVPGPDQCNTTRRGAIGKIAGRKRPEKRLHRDESRHGNRERDQRSARSCRGEGETGTAGDEKRHGGEAAMPMPAVRRAWQEIHCRQR